MSNPAAWIGADIFFVISYLAVMRGLRKKKAMLETEEEPVDGDHITIEEKKEDKSAMCVNVKRRAA